MAEDNHSNKSSRRATASSAKSSLNSSTKEPGGRGSPSGFVLKLYQMVNGAPDNILSWTPDGEAFRISDLTRLESETLPSFFRHSRFQSLVRQLNFYNFRKINRERTFWVYFHPLFHRDRPQELHKLRRRTCPGFDGRRHRPHSPNTPLTAGCEEQGGVDGSVMSNDDDEMEYGEEGDESTFGFFSPTGGAKVSRSPSPELGHNRSVRALTRTSARLGGIKSIVSEEERSPFSNKKSSSKSSSWENNSVASMNSKDDEYTEDDEVYVKPKHLTRVSLPTHPPPSSKSVNDEASSWHYSEQQDDDCSGSNSSTRKIKKTSDRDIRELADVSRQLNAICREYNVRNSTSKPKSRRGRPPTNHSVGIESYGSYGGRSNLAFGLDKPYSAYSLTKCDMFTYDDEDDCILENGELQQHEAKEDPRRDLDGVFMDMTPASQDHAIIESLIRACQLSVSLGGKTKSIAAAALSFCLSTHPQDPNIALKIISHIKLCPLLAEEFESYCTALSRGRALSTSTSMMSLCINTADTCRHVTHHEATTSSELRTPPSQDITGSVGISALEDLKRDWKTFSRNYMNLVLSSFKSHGIKLNAAQTAVIDRCASIWLH
mmetsp:Transcript_15554/g.31584  ORF Transcript_15554/g.31584 Transcript_15554/m.31584 type:complete len:603 (-) Transcript_15554:232-2040(-)